MFVESYNQFFARSTFKRNKSAEWEEMAHKMRETLTEQQTMEEVYETINLITF